MNLGIESIIPIASIAWISVTLVAYILSVIIYAKFTSKALFHPLIVTGAILAFFLWVSDTSVEQFQTNTQLIDWMLGPATVALALPLYRQISVIRRLGFGVLAPVFIGGVLASALAWLIMLLSTENHALQMTMLVKSISTPFAMDVAAAIGGIPGLAAVVVIVTGMVGAISAAWLFALFGINAPAAQGIALGTISHAIGTSRAIQMGEQVAAMATLAMCVNGLFTALILSLLSAIG